MRHFRFLICSAIICIEIVTHPVPLYMLALSDNANARTLHVRKATVAEPELYDTIYESVVPLGNLMTSNILYLLDYFLRVLKMG
jgi:hypothetical protein